MKTAKHLTTLGFMTCCLAFTGVASAQTTAKSKDATQTQSKAGQANMPALQVKDVETLLDNKQMYEGKKVTVTGEVKRKIDAQSFVLEGGGILNDEVVAIMKKDGKMEKMKAVKEDANLKVTGTLMTMPIIEVRRELSWDLDPQIESELEGTRGFLVVDEIASR